MTRFAAPLRLGMRMPPRLECVSKSQRQKQFFPVPADAPDKRTVPLVPVRESYLGRLAPYLDRDFRLSWTPTESSFPRMMWYRTPGRSLTLPPRIKTTECSCRLCPSPGMYTVTSTPLVRRTLATFRRAEFGFFGVVV